ncbi:DUF494 domain-containing protein [Ferrimonas sediminicola]|uniref:Protein Smg homolog n=1 Tax=Ferrimonas sediminicola TaxID=2569538 RepID=A0A4U1B8N4_9GAMM|nr:MULTISPECIES: DUF494 family protein [Ferrimonas]TKB46967.1 DUF494 domain-containing protein [Ferrimonas sediminicola]BDY02985.1 protein Smg [Ferrimonas sp. YFM]
MFDILMYLFETYVQSDVELLLDREELTEELSRAGFKSEEIGKALIWIEKLAALQDGTDQPYLYTNPNHSLRVYTEAEQIRLDTACRGFLLFLEQIQVLSGETREMVIDRVMELDGEPLSLDDLKWVVLMVLFNAPGNEGAYRQMEDLVFEEPEGMIH